MDKELAILEYFFNDPTREYHIREIARLVKVSHMTARHYLRQLAKKGLLALKSRKLILAYSANVQNKQFRNLKLYYNLETIRKSKLIDDLERFYDYPVIVLFGSYALASNTKESDIDICLVSSIQKAVDLKKYQKVLKRTISIHQYSPQEFRELREKNPGLLNSICNGLVLSGELEIA